MFPLGSVLFPGMSLPLHVFEARYRALVADCLERAGRGEAPEFGVVLIERGIEVGGGDVRFGIGTVARFTEVAELPDGRYAAMAVGARRLVVRAWLEDDPYPVADVEDLDDLRFDEALDRPLLERAESAVRRCLVLKAELGEPSWPPGLSLGDEPAAAPEDTAWLLAAIAPLGPLDQLALLGSATGTDLLASLAHLAEEQAGVLAFRLGSG